MLQDLPPFEFDENALVVREFLYEFWCEHGRGPNLRDVSGATGLGRERILRAYRQLEYGIILVADHRSQNANLLKLQPFSSYPTQVQVHVEGRFHSFAGCAMESVAVSRMPPFAGKAITLESYCACCLAPLTLEARDGDVTGPDGIMIHVSTSPYEWGVPDIMSMCDSMNYVVDADHAGRHERRIGRRGALFTLAQAREFVAATASERMWHREWPPGRLVGKYIVDHIASLGVDVSGWRPPR